MLLEKGFEILDENKTSGINVRFNTELAAWNMKTEMIVEMPFRVQGGKIQCQKIGAFSYCTDNASIRGVKSIGRFVHLVLMFRLGL